MSKDALVFEKLGIELSGILGGGNVGIYGFGDNYQELRYAGDNFGQADGIYAIEPQQGCIPVAVNRGIMECPPETRRKFVVINGDDRDIKWVLPDN